MEEMLNTNKELKNSTWPDGYSYITPNAAENIATGLKRLGPLITKG
jgi:hypothetical protein